MLETYRLERFSYNAKNGVTTKHFWVHSTLDVDDAYALLLDSYRPTSGGAKIGEARALGLRLLILANDMEDEARRLGAAFADQTDILTLAGGAKSEKADALYVAADLVRQAHAKIKDLGI